jgi:cytidylate kinase
MTIGIALSVKSNLGVSPVSSIPYTMTCVWGIEMGKASISYWFWFRSSYCEETSSNYVITISREFGSGGREIGKLLAERFAFHYYDSELIRLAAEKSGFSPEYVEQNDLPMVDQLFAKESALIHELSQRGSCIIVGRLANYILKDIPTAYHVFISADLDAEAARVSARDNISPQSAAAKVKKVNHERAIHCRHFTKTDWGNVKNYDLCIKSDDFGVAETAQIIGDLFQKKMGLWL